MASHQELDSLLKEKRIFKPLETFSNKARIKNFDDYQKIKTLAHENPQKFWAECAEELHWFSKWKQVLEWKSPDAQWFIGGTTNMSYNCLDRHLPSKAQKPAIIWVGEPGEQRILSFQELYKQVATLAQALLDLGLKKGDRVIVYMPMIPELAISLLACARIGLVHSVIFGGFSSTAIKDRVKDAQAKLIITADGGFRRGNIVPLKDNVDKALYNNSCVEKVIVFQRTNHSISWNKNRDLLWSELFEKTKLKAHAVPMDSEDPLFMLYTSGTTGKPKGILHTTGGYSVYAHKTAQWVFDLKADDIFWCTADIGWITGHTYVLYGILSNGVTTLMYEGAPDHPHKGRFWDIIDKHNVSIFYTAPTAIRAFIQWGDQIPLKYNLKSLRLLGTVGEPINPEAWMWYHEIIGRKKCPIVDTWWQTETGGILISPLPGAVSAKPGSATLPLPGIEADVVDQTGTSLPPNKGGFLVIKKPWPAMLRTIYKDHDRYIKQYWTDIPGFYWTGDEARRDEDGYFWIMGRADDVIKVSGHRLGSAEIESALVSHPAVAEAAVVGIPHALKGQAIAAYVTLVSDYKTYENLSHDLKLHVASELGSLARPESISIVDKLPKTRSGKIMRRLLRDMAVGHKISGDTTTLEQ
ncbi:MAG: acetate--CoA ligase [Deltaproteobacteria bacterium]|nr:acetate--CoA ligase [Deltaproteobacteria bacterium]